MQDCRDINNLLYTRIEMLYNDLNQRQVEAPLTLRYMYGTFPEMYNVLTHECS